VKIEIIEGFVLYHVVWKFCVTSNFWIVFWSRILVDFGSFWVLLDRKSWQGLKSEIYSKFFFWFNGKIDKIIKIENGRHFFFSNVKLLAALVAILANYTIFFLISHILLTAIYYMTHKSQVSKINAANKSRNHDKGQSQNFIDHWIL
jgi:hypothetical protein